MHPLPYGLALFLALSAWAQDPASTTDRLKFLESENARLTKELEAAHRRIQELDNNGVAVSPPTTTHELGPDPWGNPLAAMRTIKNKFRADVQGKGQSIPDATSDSKVVQSYRRVAEKWIEANAKFRQPIEWRIEVIEASIVSTNPKEFEFRAHVLRSDDVRVGSGFAFRMPAAAVPDLVPSRAAGTWLLSADLGAHFKLKAEATQTDRANPFGEMPLIAPQVECDLRYTVRSLRPDTKSTTPAAKPA